MLKLHKKLFLLALALSFSAASARADVFVVDSMASSNAGACTAAPDDCSLGAAITRANANSGADTITIGPNVGFIQLDTPLPTFTDNAQTSIVSTPGKLVFVRQRSGSFRVVTVAAGANLAVFNTQFDSLLTVDSGGIVRNSGTFVAVNCQFINARATVGAAIENLGGSVSVQRSRFNNCHATDRGGVILNSNNGGARGTVALNDCAFQFCDALSGGALFNEGDMVVRRSSFNTIVARPATFVQVIDRAAEASRAVFVKRRVFQQ